MCVAGNTCEVKSCPDKMKKKKKYSLKLKACRLIFQTALSFKAAILFSDDKEVLYMEVFLKLKNLVYISIFYHNHR